MKNGIHLYVSIYAKYSEPKYILNSFLVSGIADYVDLSQINIIEAHKLASSNVALSAVDIYEQNPTLTTTEIGNMLGLERSTVRSYLTRFSQLGMCSYNTHLVQVNNAINANLTLWKSVYCVEDNMQFNSIKLCAEYYGISISQLSNYLNYNRKLPINKTIKFKGD